MDIIEIMLTPVELVEVLKISSVIPEESTVAASMIIVYSVQKKKNVSPRNFAKIEPYP